MHGVEAMCAVHKIGRGLGRAADTGELGDVFRLHAHFIHGVNDALGNGVVAAARAQRGLAPAIIENAQPDMVGFWCGSGRDSYGHYLASWETIASVTERASMGSPL